MTIKEGNCEVCGKFALLDNNQGKARLCCVDCYYKQPENQAVIIKENY